MHTHCVVYRTGGTERYQWHRSLAMSKEQAQRAVEETRKMGYAALLVPYASSVSVGLPATFDGQ